MKRHLFISVTITYLSKNYHHCFIFTRNNHIETAREVSYTEAIRKLRQLERIAGQAAKLDINSLDPHICTKYIRIWA